MTEETKIPDYIQRMIDERNGLVNRIEALAEFMSSEKADDLGKVRFNMMSDQGNAMQLYLDALEDRIEIEALINNIDLSELEITEVEDWEGY